MKYLIILYGYFAAVSAIKQEIFKLPQEKLIKIQKIANQCAEENNVDPELFSRIVDGTLPRDEMTNKYTDCFAVKTGLVDEVGHMVVDKLVGLLGDHPLAKELSAALRKCNEVTKENRIATVVEMNRCYGETAPVVFLF